MTAAMAAAAVNMKSQFVHYKFTKWIYIKKKILDFVDGMKYFTLAAKLLLAHMCQMES